jgi:hypothetical protein
MVVPMGVADGDGDVDGVAVAVAGGAVVAGAAVETEGVGSARGVESVHAARMGARASATAVTA